MQTLALAMLVHIIFAHYRLLKNMFLKVHFYNYNGIIEKGFTFMWNLSLLHHSVRTYCVLWTTSCILKRLYIRQSYFISLELNSRVWSLGVAMQTRDAIEMCEVCSANQKVVSSHTYTSCVGNHWCGMLSS